jgi:hypothetical protein
MHPLVRELVALLPGDGDPFPDPARKRWVVAIEAAFELLYGEVEPGQPAPRARHRALPATEPDPAGADVADYGEDRRFADYADYEVRYPGERSAGPPDHRGERSNGANEPAGEVMGGARSSDQPEYIADYRGESPDTHGDADADQPWRHSAERGAGSTYSSYMWDTSSP